MLKIIQWATGTVGKMTARGVHNSPDMELVGCYTTTDAKNGRDIGDICGIGPIGVVATTDKEAIYATPADCVLHMSMEEGPVEKALAAVDDICRMLESGKNVVSMAGTLTYYPKAVGHGSEERIAAACKAGGTSYFGIGLEPGWATVALPLMVSGLSARIDWMHILEVVDYRGYDTPGSMGRMGYGKPPPEPRGPVRIAWKDLGSYRAPLMVLSEGLGITIDEVIHELEYVVAERAYDVAGGHIAAGTVCGKRYAFTAMVDGKERIKIEHFNRAGDDGPMGWPLGQGFYVTTKGDPSMKLSVEVGIHGKEIADEALRAAAAHVVHAIPLVCAAAPGMHSVLDLPPIVGRGVFTGDGIRL